MMIMKNNFSTYIEKFVENCRKDVYILWLVMYNKVKNIYNLNENMVKIAKLKIIKRYRLAVPNCIRLSFYMFPIGDQSIKTELTAQDINIINSIDAYTIGNFIDTIKYVDEGDLDSLIVEGAIKGRVTGADTGIYNYTPMKPKSNMNIDISKFVGDKFTNLIEDTEIPSYTDSDDMCANCILAEPDSSAEGSKVIKTFKGYLQVTNKQFSIIHNCDFNSNINVVYVPQSYVQKYQLRNGDELICTCKEDNGIMLLTSLFTINKVSCFNWNTDRPWFNTLKRSVVQNISSNGEILQAIINKFNLYQGDNMFLYLNMSSQKAKVVPKLINELSDTFDYIVYLNPQYSPVAYIEDCYKIAKFCLPVNTEKKHKQTIILLGANYAKRLVELGYKVAVVVDDADMIMALEDEPDLPISKTVYSCAINTGNGYVNSFTVISLKNRTIKNIKLNDVLKSAETIGLMIDNNDVDTFNSYRV